MVAERVVAEGQQTGDGAHDRPAYLSTRAVLESDWWEWARRERVGFYAANDVAAMEVLQALHERGIAVPGEAGVVGTNGTQLGELVVPPLTSISLDVEAIAQAAVDRLLSFIGHGDSARDSGPAASGLPGEPAACAVLAAAAAPVAVAGAAWVAEQRVLLAVQSGGEEEAKAGRDAQKLVPRLLIRGST
ncbi:MAG TPA: substrate-binding domain-containing protein [Desulfotomaculum sp.]|nr:substrate-binding domain-containing protein [Desulfotomaculum sp.]